MPSLQDFSLLKTSVEKIQKDYEFKSTSSSFQFFVLQNTLDLQPDEINDAITDTNYLKEKNLPSGHDRGIDAIYIDTDSSDNSIIHFYNMKYTESFEKTSNHFPSGEIDKILRFLNNLFSRDIELQQDVNFHLSSKIEEIWKILDISNPHFVVHIASNYYNIFEDNEKKRFEKGIKEHSFFKIEYHTMTDLIRNMIDKDKVTINAKIKAIGKNFFEKSDGEIRALIVNFDAKDILRILLSDEAIRNLPELDDYNKLKRFEIEENAFEDNVRIYLKQRSKINRNIKNTALSDENHQFFYFNNGITLTCDSFSYNKSSHSPVVEIENLQVVNGSQTIHALYDAMNEDLEKVSNIDLLCRLYQTHSTKLSNRIAEYTNSQNPVRTRDIRSIDYIQLLLEKECTQYNYFYERKKNMYSDKPKRTRIDAEKAGQVLMSMMNELPSEAKNDKRSIFAEKYDDVFNDSINANVLITAIQLYDFIEEQKETLATAKRFLSYSSYWILYIIKNFSNHLNMKIDISNIDKLKNLYPVAVEIIEFLRSKEIDQIKDKFSDILFFKYNKPKKHFEDNLDYIKTKLMRSV